MRRRRARGVRTHECFPLEGGQIPEIGDQVMQLTEIWYGSDRGGNLSLVYRWFVKSMETIGVTKYRYDSLPVERTKDDWVVIVDGATRANTLKKLGQGTNLPHAMPDGPMHKQGLSAIDNTVLRNVFTPTEARMLLLGRRLRKGLCRLIGLRQISILRKLSQWSQIDILDLSGNENDAEGHRLVRSLLTALTAEDLQVLGVDTESFCFQELKRRGSVLLSYGQLSTDAQQIVLQATRTLLGASTTDVMSPRAESEDIFEQFVAWNRDRPGEFFCNDKRKHIEAKLCGIISGNVIAVRRSAMERMTMSRFFPISWSRTQPLWGVFTTGPFQVRAAGIKELSRVRANECPYALLHGMSLSAGGFASDPHKRTGMNKKRRGSAGGYSLLMELQWVRDPSANIENWFLTDIEKILQEAWHLNPHGPRALMLPEEGFVIVGQNPKVGSSIRQTQHTQLSEGSLAECPILRLKHNPQWSTRLRAELDVVDVGPVGAPQKDCALFVRIVCQNPTAPAILSFLVSLRVELLTQFGGGEVLDFMVTTVGDEEGAFVIVFAPIAQLEKIGTAHPDLADWLNPLTKETSDALGLEEARVDYGKGMGQFLVAKQALREQLLCGGETTLRRIWAFNRVPGSREAVHKFIEAQQTFA